ncbi:sensor histidine kinase [Rhizohabitans arisaemae]|uniref:sensor histidine kinase n=1 Tax=Rhizohabitans arisaemae TaxID=2720610 RepID=UPI0024B15C47|nr:histidine kinase [Rhizohabitans arisaemae]
MHIPDRTARPAGDPAASGGLRIAADVGLGAASAGLVVFWAYLIADSWGGGHWWFGAAVGAVVCGLALLRRYGRGWAATAGLVVAATVVAASWLTDLPAEPGPATVLGLSVLVGSAVRALPVPAACAVATGGLAVAVGSLFTANTTDPLIPPVTMLNIGGWLAGLAVGVGTRTLAARRRNLADAVRRHERLQLARELHDVVAHHVTDMVLQAQAAQVLARRQPDRLHGSLSDIQDAGSSALTAMRSLVGLLRQAGESVPAMLGQEHLGDLIGRFSGPEVRLRLPDGMDESAWPPEVTGTVYRVVQESLTNVSRHARHARTVQVTVACESGAVTVEVTDDGSPIPTRRRTGYGLIGMEERVRALGGTLRSGPGGGGGWSVLATLPLPARSRR